MLRQEPWPFHFGNELWLRQFAVTCIQFAVIDAAALWAATCSKPNIEALTQHTVRHRDADKEKTSEAPNVGEQGSPVYDCHESQVPMERNLNCEPQFSVRKV